MRNGYDTGIDIGMAMPFMSVYKAHDGMVIDQDNYFKGGCHSSIYRRPKIHVMDLRENEAKCRRVDGIVTSANGMKGGFKRKRKSPSQ